MDTPLVAHATITIHAPRTAVWQALTDPERVKRYYFGTELETTWAEGSPIVWRGEWQGKPYEDRGVILRAEPERLMRYTHFSPLAGQPDVPENYHTITIALTGDGADTTVTLAQDNNATEDDRAHSAAFWTTMLEGLKRVAEA